MKKRKKNNDFQPYFFQPGNCSIKPKKTQIDLFSRAPTLQLCQGIQVLLNELFSRDIKIANWDHKEKFLRQIYIVNNKIYFLEDDLNEK